MRLEPGAEIVIRDIQLDRVLFAWPMRVVADRPDALLAAQVPGAVGKVLNGYRTDPLTFFEELQSPTPTRVDRTWSSTITLLVVQLGQWWATRLMWDAETGQFLCYYVDLLRPPRRHGLCVDTADLALDLVVLPDGSHSWKDEDQVDIVRQLGWLTDEDWASFDAARDEILEALRSGRFPFDGSLLGSRPDPTMTPAVLPSDWDSLSSTGT